MKKNTIVLILGLAGFVVMADNWVVSPILPAISKDLNIEVTRAGLLISAYMIPFGLFQLVFGPLADRYGKRQVINTSLVFFTIATALTATGVGLTDLAVYRALTGIFAAAVMPISMALIGDIFPMQERQSAIGTLMGIAFLGQGLSMAIGGSVAYFLNWRGVFFGYTLLALIPMLLLFTVGKEIPSVKNPDSKYFKPYAALIKNPVCLRTYLVVLMEGIFLLGSFSYLGGYIAKTYHYNYMTIGFIMTSFGIAAIIGGRISGKLSARIGRKSVLLLGLASASSGDILIYLVGDVLGVLIFSVVLLGLGFMLAHSTLLTYATEFAAKARGAAMSLVAFCFMGGGGIGTAVGGRLIALTGYDKFYIIYGSALFVLVLLAWVMVTEQVVRVEGANSRKACDS